MTTCDLRTLQKKIQLATANCPRQKPLYRRKRPTATAWRRHFSRRRWGRGRCFWRRQWAVTTIFATANSDGKTRRLISDGNWLLNLPSQIPMLATAITVAVIFKTFQIWIKFLNFSAKTICDGTLPSPTAKIVTTTVSNLIFTKNLQIQISFNPQ